jgi:hypothetical protein
MEKKDLRMKACNELLTNIKVFKLYNWEIKMAERVREARRVEIHYTYIIVYLVIVIIFLNWGSYNFITVSAVDTLVLNGWIITPGPLFAGIYAIN